MEDTLRLSNKILLIPEEWSLPKNWVPFETIEIINKQYVCIQGNIVIDGFDLSELLKTLKEFSIAVDSKKNSIIEIYS